MPYLVRLALTLVIVQLLNPVHALEPNSVTDLSWQSAPCPGRSAAELAHHRADCSYLSSKENRQQPNSRPITLAAMRLQPLLPAQETLPPVVFLQGGPGFATLSYARYLSALGFFQNRQLILLDQRGTGYSRPWLCPEMAKQAMDLLLADLNPKDFQQALIANGQQCIAQLQQQGADLAGYSSAANVEDLEQLRQSLGFKQWDLYGGSYGSRLALRYLQQAPQAVRAVVLDSPLPIAVRQYEQQPSSFLGSLQALSAECANQGVCEDPEQLLNQLAEIATQLNQKPLLITAEQSSLGPATINAADFLAMVHQLLYRHDYYPDLPVLLEQTRLEHTEGLIKLVENFSGLAQSMHWALFYAVQCREEAPFNNRQKVQAELAQHPALASFSMLNDTDLQICQHWPAAPIPAVERQATRNHKPVLLLSGEYDPITPPAYAAQLQQQLGNSYWLNFPGIGHGAMVAGECIDKVVKGFFAAPDTFVAQQRAPACIAALSQPDFRQAVHYLPKLAPVLQDFRSTETVAKVALSAMVLVAAAAVLIWPWRRPKGAGLAVQIFWLGWAAAGLICLYLLGLAWTLQPLLEPLALVLAYGLPKPQAFLLWIAPLLLLLALPLTMGCVLCWQRQFGQLWWRIHLAGIAIMVLVLAVSAMRLELL